MKLPGRPRIFHTPEEFYNSWVEYFKDVDANPWIRNEPIKSGELAGTTMEVKLQRPYSVGGYLVYHMLKSNFITTFRHELEKKDDEISSSFLTVLDWAEKKCREQKFDGAAVGAFNANIIARELGLVERQDTTSNGKEIGKSFADLLKTVAVKKNES